MQSPLTLTSMLLWRVGH